MSKENLALTNAAVFDGRPESPVLERSTILIDNREGGRIAALGPSDRVAPPEGFRVVDLSGKYVVPGLINAHVHLMGDGRPKMPTVGKKAQRLVAFAKTGWGRRIFLKRMRDNLERALNSGTTTVRSVGDPFFYDVVSRDRIEAGEFFGPRLLVAGKGICASGGHGHLIFLVADSPWEGRRAVRMNVREGVDLIKILNTGGVSDSRQVGEAGQVKMTLEEIRAVCDEAHRAGLLVAAHAQSTLGVKEALLGGVDTIEHGAEFDDEIIALFKDNPAALRGYSAFVPTLLAAEMILGHRDDPRILWTGVQLKNAEIIRDGTRAGLARALREGVRVGCGTDAFVPFLPHYDTWKEVALLAEHGGLSNKEALHLATLSSAAIIGVGEETGSLEPGKSADLVVLEEDPLADLAALAKPAMVCCRGRLIEQPRVKRVKGLD